MPVVIDFTTKILLILSALEVVVGFYYAIKAYEKSQSTEQHHRAMQEQYKEYDEIVLLGLQAIIDQSISDTIEDYELAARAKKLMDKIKNKQA